jgi:hypothetical protein
MAFRSLKYTYVSEKSIRGKLMRFRFRNTDFANLRLCDLRTGTPLFPDLTPQKSANLLLRNELKNLRICDLWTNQKIGVPPFDKRNNY